MGGHYGWLQDSTGGRIASKALAVSVWTPLAGGFELRGEGFVGQALAGLGGGGIGQNMVRNGVPVEAKGGWVQLNYRAGSVELGAGGGIDDPDDDDLVAASRLRNMAFGGHLIWRHATCSGRAGGAGDSNPVCGAGAERNRRCM